MIDGRKVLGLIVGRGGSKGLPRKNVKLLHDRPLIAWTVAAGLGAETLDRLVVSTDDAEIAEAARAAGADVPFMRPPELATDAASVYDAINHAIDSLGGGFDLVVLLQATSPLRTSADIDGAVRTLAATGATTCIGVTPSPKSPAWMFTRDEVGHLTPLLQKAGVTKRRQVLPPTYLVNGAVYVGDIAWVCENQSFFAPDVVSWEMPGERSVDIDTDADFAVADYLMAQRSEGTFHE